MGVSGRHILNFVLGESDDFVLGESDDFVLGESDDFVLGESDDQQTTCELSGFGGSCRCIQV